MPSVGSGSKDVSTPGTPVPVVSSTTPLKWCILMAKSANAGKIYLGEAGLTRGSCMELTAGQAITLLACDLSLFYVDCEDGNTDGVVFTYYAD